MDFIISTKLLRILERSTNLETKKPLNSLIFDFLACAFIGLPKPQNVMTPSFPYFSSSWHHI